MPSGKINPETSEAFAVTPVVALYSPIVPALSHSAKSITLSRFEICNQQVVGSNPTAGLSLQKLEVRSLRRRPCVTDCVTHIHEPNRAVRPVRNLERILQGISGLSEPTCQTHP
jgi:hypothetical protein